MRKFIFLLVIGLSLSPSVVGQDIDKMPVVSVTGTAEVLVAPDEVVFSVDVTKTDKDLQTAKRLNDESIGKVLELTRRFAFAPQNVKTEYISVDMKYDLVLDPKRKIVDADGDEVGKRVFVGYQVSKTVFLRLTEISRFEEFFSEVLKAGVSGVNSVTFETSKLRENKDIARDMAMKAAKEKATALAASVGQTIGKAVKIIEGSSGNQSYSINGRGNNNSVSMSDRFTEGVATFAPGAIRVEAVVTVAFLLN